MSLTMTQKILADHAGMESVERGQLILANLDLVLGNDITAPIAIHEFERIGVARVFDNNKIALVPDHFAPNKDIKSAEQCKIMREFAVRQGIKNYFEVGEMGIEHVLLPEKGLVIPGDAVIGADSHTCTYGALGAFATGVGSTDLAAALATGQCWFKVPSALQFVLTGEPEGYVGGKDVILYIIGRIGVDGARYRSMEFCGSGVGNLSMDSRFTIANMAIEAGAKNGIFPVDRVTSSYVKARSKRTPKAYEADENADYDEIHDIDLSRIRPMVALPHLPENALPIDEVGEVPIDQVVIGSCTNGRLEDLRVAAHILKGKKTAKHVRTIIIPGTQDIYLKALQEGLITIFIQAGAVVSTPTCGPCLGGFMGVLGRKEIALSTTNRNFRGRMGHPESEVYLAGPAVAAASAVTGRISEPGGIEEYSNVLRGDRT